MEARYGWLDTVFPSPRSGCLALYTRAMILFLLLLCRFPAPWQFPSSHFPLTVPPSLTSFSLLPTLSFPPLFLSPSSSHSFLCSHRVIPLPPFCRCEPGFMVGVLGTAKSYASICTVPAVFADEARVKGLRPALQPGTSPSGFHPPPSPSSTQARGAEGES